MHVRNNYDLGVMNGEVGAVCWVEAGKALEVDYGDRRVEYDMASATQLRLCYATTIHKSQGSEYPAVIVPAHSSNSYMLTRKLLYTAVTRGQDHVYLIGDTKGIKRAVSNAKSAVRYSALGRMLGSHGDGGAADV